MTGPAEGLDDRIRNAIQEHLDAAGGGMVTDFVLVADYVDAEGDLSYFLTCAPDQRLNTTLGLIRWADLSAEADARRYHDSG